jgi:aspartyl-tRNA synthetase
MFQLDDKFLQDLGLDSLPADQKQAFLAHIYSELELRVGVRLSEGLSDEQLSEFESFVDRKEDKVQAWINANTPEYLSDPAYQQLKANAPEGTEETILLAEYASLKWLNLNRPNYRDVVAQVLGELKAEIMSNRDTILGGTNQDQIAA